MTLPAPAPFGTVSRQYQRRANPTCSRCEYATHPAGRMDEGAPVCTRCIREEADE